MGDIALGEQVDNTREAVELLNRRVVELEKKLEK